MPIRIEAMHQWIIDFGFPIYLISDHGGAFANKLLQLICETYGIKQNLHSICVHYSNGAVERTNREINTMIRALIAECELDEYDWRSVFGVVQFALNHTPLKILNMNTPSQVMLGTKEVRNLLDTIAHNGEIKNVSAALFKKEYTEAIQKAITYRGYIHKDIINEKDKQHALARKKQLLNHKVSLPSIEVGDYVLVAKPERLHTNKLTLKWRGPEQAVEWVTPYVVKCRNIINQDLTDYHISRVQEYADSSLEITTELKRIAIYGQKGYQPVKILEHRWATMDKTNKKEREGKKSSKDAKELELLVSWLGLTEEEATYVSISKAIEDFPELTHEYLKEHKLQAHFKHLAGSLPLKKQ